MEPFLSLRGEIYYVVHKIKEGKDWVPHRFSTKTDNRILAENILENYKSTINSVELENPEKITANSLFDNFLQHKKWLKAEMKTLESYKSMFRSHFADYLGAKEIVRTTEMDLRNYFYVLSETRKITFKKTDKNIYLSPSSLRRHKAMLSQFYKYCIYINLIKDNPVRNIELPKTEKFEANFLEMNQVKTLLDALKGKRLELPVTLAALMGLRLSEVIGMTWKYVELEKKSLLVKEVAVQVNGELILKKPKTHASEREIPIPTEVFLKLMKTKEINKTNREHISNYNKGDFVVLNNLERYTINQLSHQFSKFIKAYIKDNPEFPRVRFHDLRHSYASFLIRKKIDVKMIAKLMGHASVTTTLNTYAHIYREMEQETADTIDAEFKQIFNKLAEIEVFDTELPQNRENSKEKNILFPIK